MKPGLPENGSPTTSPFVFNRVSLLELLKGLSTRFELLGSPVDDYFTMIVPITDIVPSALSFVDKGRDSFLAAIKEAAGGLVLVEWQWGQANREALLSACATVVMVDRPRLTVARILDRLEVEEELMFQGIHPSALVDPKAAIHPTATIGPFCVIGACEIGEDSMILPYTIVDHHTIIGKRVVIRSHCSIGVHSLGYTRDEKSAWVRIPHVGRAVIEDDVDIFPYTVMDRGTLVDTRICRGAKIGCYTWVSHNSCVGQDAMITGNVVLCGQSTVGARTWVGIGAIVKQGVHVGSDSMLGLGAVVLRDVPDGSVMAGVPARPITKGDK